MTKYIKTGITLAFFLIVFLPVFSQTEVEPWGNITGIRVHGQLMEFETNISVVQKGWSAINATGKEKQRPKYSREGDKQIISTNIDSLFIKEVVADAGEGTAKVNVQLNAKGAMQNEGVYFSVLLPDKFYAKGTFRINNLKSANLNQDSSVLNKYLKAPASSIHFNSSMRQLAITFEKPVHIIYRRGSSDDIQFLIPMQMDDAANGDSINADFSIKASGT
ncbi:MAG: hypothetical protein ACRDE5_04585, partial [Ginsengibacter sp.]